MSPRLARWLVRLYPRDWRARYGEEFESLLQDSCGGFRVTRNVLGSAFHERVVPPLVLFVKRMWGLSPQEVGMSPYPNSVVLLGRKPSAFLPVGMSLAALAIVLFAVATSRGAIRESDEGAAAHPWQLLMAAQVPVMIYFVIRWLPRIPRLALAVFGLQILAAMAAMAPVFLLGL